MVYTPHQVIKPEVLANTAVGMLEQELVIPNLFARQGIDQFRGAQNDTINFPVEGVLPFHNYAFRNDRSQPINFDVYTERKTSVKFGGNVYSAVKVTDEQNDFDLNDWSKLLRPQVKAVARGLSRGAIDVMENAPYAVTIAGAEANLRSTLIEARRVLNAFNIPDGSRYIVVGSNFEAAILNDDKLVLAQNVGDSNADSALRSATIGQLFGFNIIVDQTIGGDVAYAFASSAFALITGAPSVPQSVAYGATTSFESYALRWVRDYDPAYMQERSVVNTYAGYDKVVDVLVGWDKANGTEVVSSTEHFVWGIKLELGGTAADSIYPTGELATITGLTAPVPAV